MAEELSPEVIAAIQEAVAAGMAAGPAPSTFAAPAGPSLTMTSTPKLGLKQPAMDDPALITDLNDNMTILDDAITATVTATLYNKTLEAPVINNPTIVGWTNASHTHLDAAGGGSLDGGAIVSGDIGTGFVVRESYVQDFLNTGGANLVDAVVRDTLWWGPTVPPGGAPDASLRRTGAGALRLDTHLGVGAAIQTPLSANHRWLFMGAAAGAMGDEGTGIYLTSNLYHNGTAWVSIKNLPASVLGAGQNGLFWQAATVAGANQPVTALNSRLAMAQTGTLTLTPDTGQPPLVMSMDAGGNSFKVQSAFTNQMWLQNDRADGRVVYNTGASGLHQWAFGGFAAGTVKMALAPTGTLTLYPDVSQSGIAVMSAAANGGICSIQGTSFHIGGGTWPSNLTINRDGNDMRIEVGGAHTLRLGAGNAFVTPRGDGTDNLGHPSIRWGTVYAITGTIQTSHVSLKEDFLPLDGGACVQAVLDTDWLGFNYKLNPPPPPVPLPPAEAETDEQRQQREAADAEALAFYEDNVAAQRSAQAQRGYVLGSDEYRVSDLFGQSDRRTANPHSDLAVVACALQHLIREVQTLKEALNAPS